ncbi:NAD(P)/FAD-dependent oxidoreductase [Agromyces mangrovi Wang et al. 2018]|uniref:NAD(P)/FAD-dependent oxidoreductase n=1 Tax=Agromyces mangrovi TaxID=1858653 RepID=UPI0025735D09|nr:FAD-binding oxidoreductase [Agromyces mangrovi]BDZ65910.1 FAD-dependent oxidoreductase [Agromyces mangrovi]
MADAFAAVGDAPYRGVSFWLDALVEQGLDDLTPRPSLEGDLDADVCVIGGGLTGLWSAYYLSQLRPDLSIVVVEREIAGFGASGRNGGWCSALFPQSSAALERRHGREAAVAMRHAMIDTVDEVGRVADAEGIDCDFVRGGTVVFARGEAQARSARADVAEAARFGTDPVELWEGDRLDRFGVSGLSGGSADAAVFDPSCARVQPAKLVRGLARVVEERGVRIAERTEVVDWEPGRVRFRASDGATGTVRARHVLVATEGYGAALPHVGRRILPLYSLMIATEPLPAEVWDEIGLAHGETFSDYRHLLIYGQRTADDRIAFGGRGARYHWGSAVKPEFDRDDRVFAHLAEALADLMPAAADARITHRWGGPLGVPRDWHASASYNPANGVGFAGGYVGDGLSTTNLAGRTLADLVLGRDTDLTRLPWVGHRSPRWEPEPLRFLGANLGLTGIGLGDVEERVTGRPSVAAKLLGPLIGA